METLHPVPGFWSWVDTPTPWLTRLRQMAHQLLTPAQLTRARCLVRGYAQPRWGNLRRVAPMSEYFGFERGTPVDRYYLHRFLDQERAWITGRVLEIQSPGYTRLFGHDLTATHAVDIVPTISPRPTYVVDLAQAEGTIPDNSYDCFLLPNTLCVLKDIEGALRNALRVVKPGGVILASTGVFVQLTGDEDDYWRLTGAGWRELAERVWPGCEIRVEQHGNCLTAMGAMLGLSVEEFSRAELEAHHRKYPVLVTLFCRKPLA